MDLTSTDRMRGPDPVDDLVREERSALSRSARRRTDWGHPVIDVLTGPGRPDVVLVSSAPGGYSVGDPVPQWRRVQAAHVEVIALADIPRRAGPCSATS